MKTINGNCALCFSHIVNGTCSNPNCKQSKMSKPLDIVKAQAEDEGLWFIAKTAPEAYLQGELRRLHAAIENVAEQSQ